MNTLLLRLAGPMQSWGTQSRFSVRDTGMEPSKSGVIGLLCAALGRQRSESVDDLASFRMGVRVDFEGTIMRDWQTAGGERSTGEGYGVVRSSGKRGETVISSRYYLADADFLVGLEGEDSTFLKALHSSLNSPKWQLSLGRKAFVPGVPIYIPDGLKLGIKLTDALTEYVWPRWDIPDRIRTHRPDRLRFVLETSDVSESDMRIDQPVGNAFERRRFLPRRVLTDFKTLGTDIPVAGSEED